MANSAFETGTSITAATQADQETGTSVTTFVSPGRQQYHQSAAKVWAKWNGAGTAALDQSYNVTSLTDNNTGDYTITFTVNFSNIEYTVSMGCADSSASRVGLPWGSNVAATWTYVAPTVSAIRVTTVSPFLTFADSSDVSITCFGDQ